ncbi:MAG TPA: tail fiber domain-containing protein [Longimicrobium sp.]|nr:tail fiber domain-containing protein [Longimicrobium sp.]
MRRKIFRAALAAAALLSAAAPASLTAQSDILLRLRSGSPLGDRFRVDSASGFVAKGFIGIGIIPFTGSGDRTLWHPFKAGFRTGGVDGTQWDDSNFGFYSFASGFNTIAQGNYSIAAGYGSWALQSYGVGLGYSARSDGVGSVALGYLSTADGNYSVAIGQRASSNGFSGAIVLSDQSSTDSLEASANNQFSLRAAGGIRLFTNATKTTGVQVAAGGSSWAVISDRNRKANFLAVNGEDLLLRLRGVPVTTWRYRDEADRSTLHIGPMAQDWHRAFGFTADSTTINMSDFDGVNLAAIQALEARTAQLQASTAEVARLRAELDATRGRLEQLEAAVRKLQEARQ